MLVLTIIAALSFRDAHSNIVDVIFGRGRWENNKAGRKREVGNATRRDLTPPPHHPRDLTPQTPFTRRWPHPVHVNPGTASAPATKLVLYWQYRKTCQSSGNTAVVMIVA